jgi:hypothetical protein
VVHSFSTAPLPFKLKLQQQKFAICVLKIISFSNIQLPEVKFLFLSSFNYILSVVYTACHRMGYDYEEYVRNNVKENDFSF